MKWILLFIYLLMILGVIFLERKQPTEALLWVVVLVCLPYLGAVLYLVFGSTMAIKLTAYLRKNVWTSITSPSRSKLSSPSLPYPTRTARSSSLTKATTAAV